MVSKTYTTRELLRMKQNSAEKGLYKKMYEKLHKDTDLVEISRMPPERGLPFIEEEEDLDSQISGGGDGLGKSSVRQLDGTDAEWKYRGRTGSEHSEHQPIGAPAGLSAQRDEGFQRFYKAVVSPTHVRVTAGGRIVPNTRGPSSPTAKWSKEKMASEPPFMQRQASHDHGDMHGIPVPTPMPHPPAFGPFPPMFPGFFPGMHPGIAAGPPAPFAMMPWQMGVGVGMGMGMGMGMGNSFGVVHPHVSQMHQKDPSLKPPGASSTLENKDESANSESSKTVHISPPERFDQNRPFFFNGQWIMPSGGPFYPCGVAPLPAFPFPGAGTPALMHHRMAMPAMMHASPAKLNGKVYTQMPSPSGTPRVAEHSTVPMSSIRPSDITKKQIEALKSTLRYFEDQLQYNRHQIDEKGMEAQAKLIRQQIHQFDQNLKAQLQNEQAHYSSQENQKDASSSTAPENGKDSASSTANEAKSERDYSQSSVSQGSFSLSQPATMQKNHEPFASRRASTLRQVKSMSAPVSAKITPESSEENERSRKTSTLPVSAALAPPFHPRANSTASVPVLRTAYKSSEATTDDCEYIPVQSEDVSKSSGSDSFHEKPYLIGQLPQGSQPNAGRTGAWLYSRDLTEDELRARHMYWGKAPHHLQKGLPKFDGKDFYPPSPVKSQTAGSFTNDASSTPAVAPGKSEHGFVMEPQKPDVDPFRSLGRSCQRPPRRNPLAVTQSEHLAEPEQVPSTPFKSSNVTTQGSGHVIRNCEDLSASPSPDGCKDKSSDEGDDGSNILFRGRKFMAANASKGRPELWQRMWKKNKSNATAVPGTVSSMTARGVLPNYSGHATASLTPAIVNASLSPKTAPPKVGQMDGVASMPKTGARAAENRPHMAFVEINETT